MALRHIKGKMMAYLPAQQLSTPYDDYPGYFLKCYSQGTTTPLSMATDSTGGTLLAKAEISSGGAVQIGFIQTAGGAIFQPYLNAPYDAYLFPTAQEADVNDTSNAVKIADNVALSAFDQTFDTISDAIADSALSVGDIFVTYGYLAVADGGDNTYEVVAAGTGTDDGGSFIDLADHQARGLFTHVSISVNQFGATGDGVTDDTVAIQAAADYCSTNRLDLVDENGTYLMTSIRVKNGIRSINMTRGTILGSGLAGVDGSTQGIIELDGNNKFSSGANTEVRLATLSFRIDMSGGDMVAIFGDETSDCVIEKCRIFGFTDHATLNHYGLILWAMCQRNIVKNNNMSMFSQPTQRGFGVDLIGLGADFGGYFSNNGVQVPATDPGLRNIITDNIFTNGSYAINLLNASFNIVTHNQCEGQNHRSVYMAGACNDNLIANNILKDYLSSGVVVGYCSDRNMVINNKLIRPTTATNVSGGGQGGILVQLSCRYNNVIGNLIDGSTNYGVYVALGSSFNKISNNDIRGFYQAGIAVEADWQNPVPANLNYGISGVVDPDTISGGIDGEWAYLDITDNEISNNTIRDADPARNVAAIFLSQTEGYSGANGMSQLRTTVRDNTVASGDFLSWNIYLYQETAGKMLGLKFKGNVFHESNDEAVFNVAGATTWNDKIEYFNGNDALDESLIIEDIAFADGDLTPSVVTNSGVDSVRLFLFGNTSSANVTDFDDEFPNQEIILRMDNNTTIKFDSAKIRPKGLVDVVGSSTNELISFKKIGTVWIERWRSF